jgi:hypothetical protein
VTRKYPLDSLQRVRAEKVDQRKVSLSDALRKAEATSFDVQRKTHAKEQLDRAVSATACGERESLERGELSAADLALGAAWGLAAGLKSQEMARAVAEAQKEDQRAHSDADKERRLLATAQAEAKVVEKHHAKWRAVRSAAQMAHEEESAEEAHLGRPKGASR